MGFNRKGYGRIIVVGILLIMVIAVTLYLSSSFPRKEEPIKIHRFEVQPPEFKISETGELLFKVENLIESDFTTITVHFETHKNVEVYLGSNRLDTVGGNYTYSKTLNPKETSDLVFTLKATVDVGDNSRDYRVKAYLYVNGNFFNTRVATFSVHNI